ncbi:sulfotransferase domain-containing protein [Vibrio alginolyticus]|uniref:sulfotransferase family protein n=1 Tax=Vibrio alginolyticus TaxID=663 RepID=UPI001D64D51F|nr:sulfotransferase domain-containing protein [Vibrio alginolyticus]EHA1098385.1 sulfotransferase domain-containing protein [Vibrio alginolyticus]EHA1120942.1 sulfotransferase domain-containing protein [Vibrio alginolyticus]EJG1636746.1 sulfotransferase domain-containing protein [Vibrio alginolyticus]MCS0130086.1 sulfotransferase domain-containing protein [Vibrio alginolyticus]MCS0136495.1 sulfotransferase domain-containing protein [Vibrio alginolyticus]
MNKVAIHSVPRSGSSWLGEIINSSPDVNYLYQPLFSYEFKSFLDDNSEKDDIEEFFNSIAQTNSSFIRQEDDRKEGKKPIFEKSNKLTVVAYKEVRYHHIIENMIKKCPDVKILGLVRDPRAVISSWYNAKREFRSDLGWLLEEELIYAGKKNLEKKEEYFGLYKWAETTKLFEKLSQLYPDNFKLVHYSALLEDPLEQVEDIFDFLGLELTSQTKSFLMSKKKVDTTYSVFKNKDKDISWQNSLDTDIVSRIEDFVKESKLEHYL